MHFADSEDPKIRKFLAEALALTAFLEAGRHLRTMATAPREQRFCGHFAEAREFQQPRLGPAGTTAPPGAEEIRKPSSSD